MGVHIDETRKHDAVAEVEARQSIRHRRTDGGDAAAVDHDVAGREAVGVGLKVREIGHQADRHARIGETEAGQIRRDGDEVGHLFFRVDALCSCNIHAPTGSRSMKRPLNPASIRAPFAQYSHAVEVPAGSAGRMVFASGQLGVAPDDTVPEDAEAQAVLCFENIKAILAEAGMTLADVVRFTAYVTDRAYFPVYGAVRSRYVSGNVFASTLVIVSGFTRPEFKVEVEVTAVRTD
jgi:enamine deaminase RidA (YjgF/YER057c/UK114 family)